MAKSRGAKRGKKKKNKRIAAHIKDAAQRRLAEKNSDHNSGGTTPLIQERPHKRPRESAPKLPDPERGTRDRAEAETYLSAWMSSKEASAKKRAAWKFNKNTQAWILRNMFKRKEVSDSSFVKAHLYLGGLQGLARKRMLEQAQAIIDKQGLGDEGKQDASEEASPKASKRVRWDDSGASPSAVDADNADADVSSSESDGGSSGDDDDQPEARGASKDTAKPKEKFSFSFSDDDATVGRRTEEGSKKIRADEKRREESKDASDDEASGSEGQENADPASSKIKKKKARTSGSASTTEEKGRLKAQAKVVAYERALQVAELLA